MVLTDDLAAFVESPVMTIIGTCDPSGMPSIGRVVGARADRPNDAIDLYISAWQWPETAANIRAGARVAVTFTRPSDYVSYQVKGTVEAARPPREDEVARSRGYGVDMTAVLQALGVASWLIEQWLTSRDLIVVRYVAGQAFVQTPGPKAGQALASGGP